MALRFLVDVGVGRQVEVYLQSVGCDVACVRDRDIAMADQVILAWAVTEQRIVITMDKDFGELHFLLGLPHCGVLLLRLDDADSDEKVRAVESILATHSNDLTDHFCVFQDGHLRIR